MVARSFGIYESDVATAPLRAAVDAEQWRASFTPRSVQHGSHAVASGNVVGFIEERSTILHSHTSGLQ